MVTLRRPPLQEAALDRRNSLRGNDMATLLENPMPIIFLGILAEAVLAILLVSLRQSVFIWAMVGVLVLVIAGVALEIAVVTEVERVEATLDGVTRALEDNDVDRLLREYVAPVAAKTEARARTALSMVEITSAKISGLRIEINRLTSPPTAEARFNGVVRFEPKTDMIHHRYYARRFTVELRLEGDRSLITDHVEHEDL